ncbi:RNA-binding protein YlmH [Scopulibacillus daqui]|uniref:RNA-binding protein YlmH n=1 Tax=Scopulibacillus daqui TaxID=1469162 RepID=A0ABS2PXR7_9BACL|nr:RNA-binding protein [Scopulibacillus daqui]MBM7644284.1 RNA-binding protein YlmH [Scopulibacillus daqui]
MSIYEHFRDDEKPFIDAVFGWQDFVISRYAPKCTDFLDPRQQEILNLIIGQHGEVRTYFCGGFEAAERKRALLVPEYFHVRQEDFGLTLFELQYPKKFAKITHREMLGALTGLGLVRDKFGDLLFKDDRVQFVAAQEIADFVLTHLTHVGNVKVSCKEMPLSDILHIENHWEEAVGTVSSLRLDAVLSEIYNLSRTKIAQYIQSGKVKVNWKPVEKTAYELAPGDNLSVRGLGRSRLFAVEGVTRKGKQRIRYGRLIS